MVVPPNERHNSIKGIVDAGRGEARSEGQRQRHTQNGSQAASLGCLISRQPCHILNKQYKQSVLLQKVTCLIGWQLAAAAADAVGCCCLCRAVCRNINYG